MQKWMRSDFNGFQSTPSVWRVTVKITYISPFDNISIHTLRVEGDSRGESDLPLLSPFQSTPSVWRVTQAISDTSQAIQISIHTLRVEGDILDDTGCIDFLNISIHTLRVEGDVAESEIKYRDLPNFNPHPPCGG